MRRERVQLQAFDLYRVFHRDVYGAISTVLMEIIKYHDFTSFIADKGNFFFENSSVNIARISKKKLKN